MIRLIREISGQLNIRQYSYGILLVYLCWTLGTRMLYSSGTVFSICLQTISRRIKSLELRNEVRRPKGKPINEFKIVNSQFECFLILNSILAMVYMEIRYGIPGEYLCCTFGARMLHFWCQSAALLLALLFVSLYSGFLVGSVG